MDEGVAQAVDLFGELARERAAGTARRGLGAGVDQVGNRLGLGQVDLVVQERPLGELAGLGQAQARQSGLRRLQAARQQQLQHHGPAVGLQLQHVLAGVAVRRGEEKRQPLVDGLALGVGKGQVMRLARLQRAAQQILHEGRQATARHAHDAHGATPWGGGDGGYRILVAGEHGCDELLKK